MQKLNKSLHGVIHQSLKKSFGSSVLMRKQQQLFLLNNNNYMNGYELMRSFSSCQLLKSSTQSPPPPPTTNVVNNSAASAANTTNTTTSSTNSTENTTIPPPQTTQTSEQVEAPPKRSKYYDEDLGRELTREEILKKQKKRKYLYIFLFFATIGGLITLALYKAMIEIQNLTVFSDMVETLFISNDKELVYNAESAVLETFKYLDENKFSDEMLQSFKSIFGDFESMKSIRLLGPNFVEQTIHRIYLISKENIPGGKFGAFDMESRLYYFFPIVNKDTGSVASLKVTFYVNDKHTADLRARREKTKKDMEERQKKEKEAKYQKEKRDKANEERIKKGEPPLEEPAPEPIVEEPKEEKPIFVPPVILESIHICDPAQLSEAFEENFFAQHDKYHLYGIKELTYSWPYGKSYTGGKSEVQIYRNPQQINKIPVIITQLGAINMPSPTQKVGHFYLENIESERVKLDKR